MGSTAKAFLIAAGAAAMAAAFSGCYSSTGPGRDGSDVSPDRPPDLLPDAAPDIVPDVGPDVSPDPIVDVVQDEILPPPDVVDVTPDVPPDLPPFEGLTFVVTNTTDTPMYFSVWQYGEDPVDIEYDLYITGESYEPPVSFYLWQPWCTLDCAEVTDPIYCCMDCIPPFVNTVKMLLPGDSFVVRWDGTVFELDYEACACGCYRRFPAPYWTYTATVCGSPEYVCFTGVECYPDESGFIHGAGLSDIMTCAERSFPVPEASGMEIELRF